MVKKFKRRAFLVGASALAGTAFGRWFSKPDADLSPKFPVYDSFDTLKGDFIEDASTMEHTAISKQLLLNSDVSSMTINTMRAAVMEARERHIPVMASGVRHSMGGQSIPEKGNVISLVQNSVQLDVGKRTYRVAAGTRWKDVIVALDKAGFSPAVMQSSHDFSVAGSFSVNAHGWAVPCAGCGSTVQSIKMMFPDGTINTCSIDQNREVFLHAMGGYGLFGVISELELQMVPNVLLEPRFEELTGDKLGAALAAATQTGSAAAMAYGRLDISLGNFLRDGLLVTYRAGDQPKSLPAVGETGLIDYASMQIFRNQLDSETAKQFRWWMETRYSPKAFGAETRNTLLNTSLYSFGKSSSERADILQEYFVPTVRYAEFLARAREIIPASYQQLLNVTVRFVKGNTECVLSYAPEDRVALVMMFSQEKSMRAETDMRRLTQQLIEAALQVGGSYYLPYRPHATVGQMKRAYPQIEAFVAFKRQHDEKLIFRNKMWDRYFALI